MDEILGVAFVVIAAIVVGMFSKRRSVWFMFSLIVILGNWFRDSILSPLGKEFLDISTVAGGLIKTMGLEDYFIAQILVSLCYFTLTFGFVLGHSRAFSRLRILPKGDSGLKKPDTLSVNLISLVISAVGFACCVYVCIALLEGNSLFEIASRRAVVTDERVVYERLFLWARWFSKLLLVGGWALMSFNRKMSKRYLLGMIANLIYVGYEVFLGGRFNALMGLIGLLIVSQHGKIKLDVKKMLLPIGGGVAVMLSIQFTRMSAVDLSGAWAQMIGQLMVSRTLDQVAFAIKNFPSQIPYFGPGVTLYGLGKFFPTADLFPHENIWSKMVEIFFSNINPSGGIAGEHYFFGAEFFMAGGWVTAIVAGLVFGWFIGIVMRWCSVNSKNPFSWILGAGFLILLFEGIQGKLSAVVGDVGFTLVLPVGFMAVVYIRKYIPEFIFGMLMVPLALFLRYISTTDVLDIIGVIGSSLAYFISIIAVRLSSNMDTCHLHGK